MNITDRFLKYVSHHTTSDEHSNTVPTTSRQIDFAKIVVKELKDIGLSEVTLDHNGYIMATLPANTTKKTPTIGFVAHMDTSPDAIGENIKPRIVENYDGKDILLNQEKNITLSTSLYPEIIAYTGQDIIVTDGTTLLGADDKAGMAEIVTAMEYLINHPEIKHGKIRIGFTPDEEVGRGADHFDVKKFDAEWAYTMDGSQIGELEFENFNAASAKITIKGLNVHPGYAKNKMKNAMLIAQEFITKLPAKEIPSQTTGYEGFFHLTNMNGTVEEATLSFIIRDHSRPLFEERKETITSIAKALNEKYGKNTVLVETADQYYNMREKIEPVKHIVDIAETAMKSLNITPIIKPIRGGTDGARLSFEGLPCPNIFAGGHNFHGRFEFVPVQSMEKATQLIVRIVEIIEQQTK